MSTATAVQNNQILDIELLKEVEQFLFKEARLADENAYRDWEALWSDDGIYWVPANGTDTNPEKEMSIIYDNRSRISLRVNQYYTGKRFSQDPKSTLRRLVSNVELLNVTAGEITVGCNVLLVESNPRQDNTYCSRNEFVLRRVNGELKMVKKTVFLTNNDKALLTMAFLI